MMYKKKKNNKAALFFILLVLVGYIFIKFGQGVSTKSEARADYEEEVVSKPEECKTCGITEIEEEVVVEDPGGSVVMIDEKYTVDITESVKGANASLFSCDDFNPVNTLESATKLCPEGGAEWDVVDAKSGLGQLLSFFFPNWGANEVRVDSETEIELVYVTYPLAFFLGQYTVENSNREANVESPNYSSSGQVIDEKYTLKTMTPDQSKELKEDFTETVREDYSVWTNANILSGGNGSGYDEDTESKYEVTVTNADNDPESPCPVEVTTSDYNPGSSNRQGAMGGGFLRTQIPGGDPVPKADADRCLKTEQDYKMIDSGLGIACIELLNLVKGKIASIFNIGKWEACTESQVECTINQEGQEICVTLPPSEECLNVRNIGIKMSPIYGSVDECTDELCANAYLTNSYRAGLAPPQSKEKEEISSNSEESLMFFLGTPCTANIKIGGVEKQVDVTCLWDASPLLLDYKLQAMYRIPNDEEFPDTFEDQWALVEKAIEISAGSYGL